MLIPLAKVVAPSFNVNELKFGVGVPVDVEVNSSLDVAPTVVLVIVIDPLTAWYVVLVMELETRESPILLFA